MQKYVTVAVLTNIPKLLTYTLPADNPSPLPVGALVFVPVRDKQYPGFVVGLSSQLPQALSNSHILPVAYVAPLPPFFNELLLAFYTFVSSYYGVSLGMVLKTAIPNLNRYAIREMIAPDAAFLPIDLIELIAKKKIKSLTALKKHAPHLDDAQIRALFNQGALKKVTDIVLKTFADPAMDYLDFDDDRKIDFTPEQKTFKKSVCSNLSRSRYYLLHGKTGTGKTELLLEISRDIVAQGRSVLFLVPEISLVPHVFRRACGLMDRESVMIWHSSLKSSVRGYELERILSGPAFVIGTRSSIFLPLYAPALIIVDEEHDQSYKHEGALPYNARDLALMRGKQFGHPVILSSATPSIESYYSAQKGKYEYTFLTTKFSPRKPEVELVDTTDKETLVHGFFSRPLLKGIEEALASGHQSLIFINRRGYIPYIYCNHCKSFMGCKNCAVLLTWHKSKNAFVCHHCQRQYPVFKACPVCGNATLSFYGAGTEKIAELLSQLFPEASILKVDRDTADKPEFFRKQFKDIVDGRYQIIVGTQIITKGHHFPLLTLVGVLMGDQGLSLPDFRAQERSFQTLTQVLGRSGREMPGRVIIQSAYPEAPSIQFAIAENYDGFYHYEISSRKEALFPPFIRLLLIKVFAKKEAAAQEVSETLYRLASEFAPGDKLFLVYPPSPAPIARERGFFRYHMYVKAGQPLTLVRLTQFLRQSQKKQADIKVYYDMDPYHVI